MLLDERRKWKRMMVSKESELLRKKRRRMRKTDVFTCSRTCNNSVKDEWLLELQGG